MDRRTFLKAVPLGTAAAVCGGHFWRATAPTVDVPLDLVVDPRYDEGARVPPPRPGPLEAPRSSPQPDLRKIADFDRPWDDDHWLGAERRPLLRAVVERLDRAQRLIGHGHFNIVGFDELLRYARNHPAIGAFPAAETAFLDEVFHADPTIYGFFGAKVTTGMTEEITRRTVRKIGGTGHYLLRGASLEQYERIRQDLGDRVFLTSGVRSVVKQFHLFLAKAVVTDGNLSQASRSLAPPGFSYHAAGDFDVGKTGAGLDNFTEAFARTDEYRRMIDLGYVDIRYTERNPYGVRHEPWHIKVAS